MTAPATVAMPNSPLIAGRRPDMTIPPATRRRDHIQRRAGQSSGQAGVDECGIDDEVVVRHRGALQAAAAIDRAIAADPR